MADVQTTNGTRELTLESGRKVVLGPLQWAAFEPLMEQVFKVYMDRIKDIGVVSQGPQFMVAAVYAMLGEPQRWMHVASTTIATWVAWGTVYSPKLPLADRRPDLTGWTAAEVAEVMEYASELTDFRTIAERLKNSLGPVADDIAGLTATGRGADVDQNAETLDSPKEA